MPTVASPDPVVLGRILLLQSALQAAPDEQRLVETVTHGLADIPGVTGCLICIEGAIIASAGDGGWQVGCRPISGQTGQCVDCPTSCPLRSQDLDTWRFAMRTVRRGYGGLLVALAERPAFNLYEPFVANTANLVALHIENMRTQAELNMLNRNLDAQVKERTAELHESETRYRERAIELEILTRELEDEITERERAEEALQQAHDQLEVRIKERTAELVNTVKSLKEEVILRTHAEEALRQRSTQLRALASELTLTEQRERQRIAQILHDNLQQLLAGIKYRTTSLQRIASGPIRQAALDMGELLDECIEMSRSLTGELSPPILAEGGLIPALEWLVRWMNEKHGMDTELIVDEQGVPKRNDLRILLFQAVRELLFNVVKHAGVKRARIELHGQDDYAMITVADAGAGFDPSQLRTEGGMTGGFGLLSIRERLDLLGGKMDIHSTPGHGSRIVLAAPLGEAPAGEGKTPSEAVPKADARYRAAERQTESSAGVTGKIRVMLVDDHKVMRQALAQSLIEEPDIEIVGEASSGEEAIEQTRHLVPDVILMDISMPGMSGIEATRRIHAESPERRIIGLSMFEEAERATAMRDAGAVAYLTKSGPLEDVTAAIRASIAPDGHH